MADWDEDSPRLADNLRSVLRSIRDQAARRAPIAVQDAKTWHAGIMDGLDVPNTNYVGRFRGEPGLELIGVKIGAREGTPPARIEKELEEFESHLSGAIAYLDDLLPPNNALDAERLDAVVDVCGWAHAQWVRIHPFANGNGRIARLWVNMIAMRYGLPPFVQLRPRPEGDANARAAAQAMDGNWQRTAGLFRSMLDQFLSP